MEGQELEAALVAQFLIEEFEKIAYSGKTRRLFAAARKKQLEATQAKKTLGARRFIPGTAAHRAYYGHVGVPGSGAKRRAATAANNAERQADGERASLLKAMETGKGNQDDIARRLQEGPKQGGSVRRMKRRLGADIAVEADKQRKPMTGRQKLLAGAGVGAGTAAAAGGAYQLTKKDDRGY